MSLKSILQLLHQVSVDEQTSAPLIVGGAVRDRVIGNLNKPFNDIDICNGDSSIFHLAKEFSIKLRNFMPAVTKQAADGHISIFTKEVKLDFSSNFKVPGIIDILKEKGIQSPTEMQQEIYSRDFHCNTLLMSLDFRKIKDITGEGIKDIKNKTIRTCLTPELTFKYNTNRIIRTVYLACKLEFDVSPDIIEWVRNNPKYITDSESEYLSKNINKALEYDAGKAIQLINQMNMWKFIPITQALYPYYKQYVARSFSVG